jgi:threonine aldolase
MKAAQFKESINPDNVHYAKSKLVIAENTNNKGGGSIYDFRDLLKIGDLCRNSNLKYHLDGARLFNALVETGESPEEYGKIFDSISICFSKGLGAPVGSVLIGDQEFITRARRVRKVFGGSMRQSGYLAAAAIYAIEHNIPLLREDHRRASELGNFLAHLSYVADMVPVQSNMVIFRLHNRYPLEKFMMDARKKGILFLGFGPQTIRMVTHLDFNDKLLQKTIEILESLE